MALSLWTLGDIKSKVRRLSGRRSETQLSDSDLADYINRYYQLQFPLEVKPSELYTWFSFDLTASTDEYNLTVQTDATTSEIFVDGYMTLDAPVTADGYSMTLYTDPVSFYDRWPETVTYDESRPENVLYYNRKLLFRSPPDDSYTVKFSSLKKPTALSSDSDYPRMEEWGIVIAYGAAIEVLQDSGDMDRIQEIMPLFDILKASLSSKVGEQNYNSRSVPRF